MVKDRSTTARIDLDLNESIKEFAFKNNISFRQASKEVARLVNDARSKNKKLTSEIEF